MSWRQAVLIVATAASVHGCAPAAVVAGGVERVVRVFEYLD